ncbi:substrate-binding periplasmic protein [Spirochaeta isovalerica]|uniref:ABC-type amino acid transport substrate-binding protein n=1 Tax=Spirochaeta isovalerica TaxID=150 RepID=A0A841RDN3_9SPIO|nr:ABC transporter substrate-binding protein [Spirochaeta isovalerica]MBB6480959.1 ABC-type amino acid transport substrate-binding protein [Spirochaeta isovalerica]
MSEEFPPYNFELNGRLQGISIDLMVLCLDKLGSRQTRQDIRILPWARSYKMLLEEEKTVLFAITRTPQRENLFKWVGPISSSKNVLFARKNSLISLSSPDDIKKYRTGAIRDDAGEQLLQDLFGLDREGIELTSSALSSLLQLKTGRIDLFAYDENVLHWIMTQEGLNPEDFESVYVLSEGFHYFGFHRDTDDELIEQFQKALDDLKDEGLYDIVLKRYQ